MRRLVSALPFLCACPTAPGSLGESGVIGEGSGGGTSGSMGSLSGSTLNEGSSSTAFPMLELESAASIATHDPDEVTVGDELDLALPLALEAIVTEPRRTGARQLVLSFTTAVGSDPPLVMVVGSDGEIDTVVSAGASQSELRLIFPANVGGLLGPDRYRVTVTDIAELELRVLPGDVDSDGVVTSLDGDLVSAHLGDAAQVDPALDVNADTLVDPLDGGFIQARLCTATPDVDACAVAPECC